ncbi:MAG: hypothetical protein LJE68_13780 [Rhodobacter sp.]|nr:hypothetical protein [Rhodobacter sp.]
MHGLMRLLPRVAAWFLLATPTVALTPPAPPVGLWTCNVNSPVVSVELQMQVNPDFTLAARGTIVYLGTSAIYNVEGFGDWEFFPPEKGTPDGLFKFRMQPQNHAIFDWFAQPTNYPDTLYNQYRNPQTGGVTETACQRIK